MHDATAAPDVPIDTPVVRDVPTDTPVVRDVPVDTPDIDAGASTGPRAQPVAPPPSASVANDRPALQVALRGGADGAEIEVCRDRACTMPLARLATRLNLATPTSPLPHGTLYWRAHPRRGGAAAGAPSTVRAVRILGRGNAVRDNAAGLGADVDCDGYEDAVLRLSGLPLMLIMPRSPAFGGVAG